MDANSLSSLVSAISSAASAMVAILAIRYSNRYSRQAIVAGKLEELYQVIDQISQYYHHFTNLNLSVADYHAQNHSELKSIAQYILVRDRVLKPDEQKLIEPLLPKIEVLAKCYTKGQLLQQILQYRQLMEVFYHKVVNLNSLSAEIRYKDGFPSNDQHREMVVNLKEEIVKEIEIR